MSERRNYMGSMWLQEEDGVITIGINEEALEDFDEVTSVDLNPEGEKVEAESVVGTIETSDGPLDIYSPVDGTVLEVNSQVIEDPSIIMEDPYEEGWLLRIESESEVDDEDEEDLEEDEEDLEEDDEDEELEDEED
ncbi:MAG: glycine cleavage system protein H [Bdellovibrionales bacterium]